MSFQCVCSQKRKGRWNGKLKKSENINITSEFQSVGMFAGSPRAKQCFSKTCFINQEKMYWAKTWDCSYTRQICVFYQKFKNVFLLKVFKWNFFQREYYCWWTWTDPENVLTNVLVSICEAESRNVEMFSLHWTLGLDYYGNVVSWRVWVLTISWQVSLLRELQCPE